MFQQGRMTAVKLCPEGEIEAIDVYVGILGTSQDNLLFAIQTLLKLH